MLHFVGFKDARYWKDMRYQNAVRVFGLPDFMHRTWDMRALDDIMDGDTIVFADGDGNDTPCMHAFDDSHMDIVFHGGDYDR